MRANKATYPITVMSRVLKVSVGGYYSWLHRPVCARVLENKRLVEQMRNIHSEYRGIYGSPRMHRELNKRGYICSLGRVSRLMRENTLRAKQKRKFRVCTTNSKHSYPVAPNLLRDHPGITGINQVWVSDITYVPTQEGWLYLASIMDAYSRKLVGWSMDKRMTKQLTVDALMMALWRRKPGKGLIHHSDQGSQYASDAYQRLLREHGAISSMSRKGNCYDNALKESFFHTLKTELIHHENYQTRKEAKRSIFEYIETLYNTKRMHSSLDFLSPLEYEQKVALLGLN
jgi:transposase InsO family protein